MLPPPLCNQDLREPMPLMGIGYAQEPPPPMGITYIRLPIFIASGYVKNKKAFKRNQRNSESHQHHIERINKLPDLTTHLKIYK